MFCFIFYENNYNFIVRALLLFYTISMAKNITWINEKNKKKVLMCLLIIQSQKKKKRKKKIKWKNNESWLGVELNPWEYQQYQHGLLPLGHICMLWNLKIVVYTFDTAETHQ